MQYRHTKEIAELVIRRVLGCDPQPLSDISHEGRTEFLKKYGYPYGQIPTLCFISSASNLEESPLRYLHHYLKLRTGHDNDGVVTEREAIIPNSNFIVKSFLIC